MMFKNEYLQYFLLITITFIVVVFLSYIIRKAIDLMINRNSQTINADPTNFIFIKNSSSFILYTIGILWVFHKIPYFKSLGTALFAGAGVLAAIIGFASQKAFSNIIGGLFILIFKPFRVDDIIEIAGGRKGVVEEITLRHTIIRDYEYRRIVIPNSLISDDTIINSSINDDKIRKHVEVGIAYDADVELATSILREVIMNHPLYIDNRSEEEIESDQPSVEIRMVGLGDFAVTLRAYVWARNYDDAFKIQCDTFKEVKSKFDEKGVEIPFPYRTIVYKNDLQSTKEIDHSKSEV